MRQRILTRSTVILAAGLLSFISLFLTSGISLAVDTTEYDGVSQGSVDTRPAEVLPEDFPPYSQIVDDSDLDRFSGPGWATRSTNPDGYGGSYHVADGASLPARFTVEIPATDVYTVYAWWSTSVENSAAASFGIDSTTGVQWTQVNQQQDSGMWVRLGSYEMAAGDRYVQVQSGGRVVADAVAVVRGTVAAPPEDGTIDLAGGKGTGRDIVKVARTHIGTPYGHKRCRKGVQEDCSCHTKLVMKRFGWRLPDDPAKQWKYGKSVARSDLRPGDLVFFKEGNSRVITHVGIYSGNGDLVHASAWKKYRRVVEKPMQYIDGYVGARRLNPR